MNTLEYALEYARRGWAVLPIHGIVGCECSCGHPDCSSPGKHPLVAHGSKDATKDSETITQWWTLYPHANIGIATGSVSSLVVVDVDHGQDKHGYHSLAKLEADNGQLPRDLCVRTGSGGLHIYLSYPDDDVRNDNNGKLGPNIDIRGEGGYVVAPPSIHHSGNNYSWEEADAV